MKFATVRQGRSTRAARVDGDELVLLDHPDAATALVNGALDRKGGPRVPLSEACLAPPSICPEKIACVGHNYVTHSAEMQEEPPSHPEIFAKYSSALIGANDPIILPAVSEEMDWEVELALVIQTPIRHASVEQARAAIGGYTILNDCTARDGTRRGQLLGKTFDKTTPVGPFLVTPDELDHACDLNMRCIVEGEVMQEARTSDMIFDPATVVAAISEIVTLHAGDLISTGTPPGAGFGRNPQVFLRAGQLVTTQIEGIGELSNVCMDEQLNRAG